MARIVTVRVKDIKVTLCNLHPYNLYKLCMQTVAIIIDIIVTINPTQQQQYKFRFPQSLHGNKEYAYSPDLPGRVVKSD